MGGSLDVPHNNSLMTVKLRQIHLEQDSGKIVFGEKKREGQRETLVDYNRAGNFLRLRLNVTICIINPLVHNVYWLLH